MVGGKEEETDRLSLRPQLQIDGRRREELEEEGEARVFISPSLSLGQICQRRRLCISGRQRKENIPASRRQEAERHPDWSHRLGEPGNQWWRCLGRHPKPALAGSGRGPSLQRCSTRSTLIISSTLFYFTSFLCSLFTNIYTFSSTPFVKLGLIYLAQTD